MKGFGSDNHSGVHPELLKEMIACNFEHQPSYGTDSLTQKARFEFKKLFGEQAEVLFVFNGTACNVLALQFLTRRYESIFCSNVSHLHMDECGAPEFFAGKLITLPSSEGKIKLEDLKKFLIRKGDQHYSQSKVISLTQSTEMGTCYSLSEIKEITTWAHQNGLRVHIDGARLTNAIAYLGCTFKEMTTDLGVDVVSFGGTKNGFLFGEAIVVLDSQLAQKSIQDLKFIRKQSAQLPSKTRFIAAQFMRYFTDHLYLEIAEHSLKMAERLFQGLQKIKSVQLTCPRQSNAVFVILPQPWIKKIRDQYFFYVWNEQTFECRLMTSWDTTENEIDGFIDLVQSLENDN